jgi:multiple sugar transport system permease protein
LQPTVTAAQRKRNEALLAYGLLAPALILILTFVVIPLAFGFWISLNDWRITSRGFVGFDNYVKAIAGDELWRSLITTITYSFLSVPIQLALALFLAVLLFQKIKNKAVFRVAMFLPYITSTVATAAVWARLYSPDIGYINSALRTLGIQGPGWITENKGIFELMLGQSLPDALAGPSLALISVIIYTMWTFTGYSTTIFLAGLGNIPGETYEAAKIDGASGWDLFRFITFPLISPTTFFLSLITVIGTFKAFNHIYVMTQGGNGTQVASILIFDKVYKFQRQGEAAALAFLLMTVILVVTIVQNRLGKNRVNY